jgi:hypothetical protein|tara:strand:- start:922 stop:1347 length:426 start_codon:yes stop_codon:yes gene_type:complete
MVKTKPITIEEELAEIREKGLLRAEDVVAYAQDEDTLLHERFEWDDTVAAHQHRLWQARQLIVEVTIVPRPETGPTQAYVSLTTDRNNGEGGGYRTIVDVMSDEELRTTLLNDAKTEAGKWRKKYSGLKELFSVFYAIDKL